MPAQPARHVPVEHDLGLSHDLPAMLGRRKLLSLFGGILRPSSIVTTVSAPA